MSYNMTALGEIDSLSSLFAYTDTASGGALFVMLSIAMFFIWLLALKGYEFIKAVIAASFITFIFTVITTYAGFTSVIMPLAYLTILALASVYAWASG